MNGMMYKKKMNSRSLLKNELILQCVYNVLSQQLYNVDVYAVKNLDGLLWSCNGCIRLYSGKKRKSAFSTIKVF